MTTRRNAVFFGLIAAVAGVACDRTVGSKAAPQASSASGSTVVPSSSAAAAATASASPAASASVAGLLPVASASATPPAGEVTLVLQHVERRSTCGNDWLGFDLLVDTTLENAPKPTRRHLFCPPAKKNMFEMCRSFQRCTAESPDAASPDRVVVQCDKETIVLEVTPTGTRVSGPNLDLEIAPVRLRVMPVKKMTRGANVDC